MTRTFKSVLFPFRVHRGYTSYLLIVMRGSYYFKVSSSYSGRRVLILLEESGGKYLNSVSLEI